NAAPAAAEPAREIEVVPAGKAAAAIAALTTSRHAVPTSVASVSFAAPETAAPSTAPGPAPAPAAVRIPAPLPDRVLAPPTGRSILRPEDAAEADFAEVELYYGTDRAPSGQLRPATFYGGARGEMDYGRVTVALPRGARPDGAEMPALYTFGWPENPDHHVVIADLDRLAPEAFFAGLRARGAATGDDAILLYVHGYDTSFAEAARRTAWMAYDAGFSGVPMFFSWPSVGAPNGYVADAAAAQVSARRLVGFLEDLVARSEGAPIHLVAQAMGGRALAQALELYAAAHPEAEAVFGQVILAAPDVDADLFALQAHAIRRLATRVTLYTNSAEAGLAAAGVFQGGVPRAGAGGIAAVSEADFDMIDMSALGEDLLAHRANAAEPTAVADIAWLMWRDAGPGRRCGMSAPTGDAGAAWRYGALDCDTGQLLPALALLRRYGAEAPAHVAALRAASGAGAAAADETASEATAELDRLAATLDELLTR
ncbi:MAG: alpha/beta hydrolase, partial [Maritimibacter sp.]|nr:alpha/beta hydrolase [Maritimibacter sp.]